MAVHDLANDVSGAFPGAPRTWRDESLCRKHPTNWWFAGSNADTALAKSICSDCVVRTPCLEFALSRPDLLGIWAATTPVDRTTLRREGRTADDVEVTVAAAAATAPVPPPSIVIDLVVEAKSVSESQSLPTSRARRGPRRGWRDGAPGDQSELLTPAEAAHKLGVTPNTVTRWSRAGKISAIQTMGGHRRFRRSEIDRVLREADSAATSTY